MKLLRSKKGFTLVEIIVVLVIIAILAAISLPALTGYISDAKDKSAISEARTVMVAVQTIASELTGLGKGEAGMEKVENYIMANSSSGSTAIAGYDKTITGLTGLKGSQIGALTLLTINDDGTVESFTYTRGGKAVYLYDSTLNLVAKT